MMLSDDTNQYSTADIYATSYWRLIVTMAVLLAVCEIFSRMEVELPVSLRFFWNLLVNRFTLANVLM